MKNDNHSQLTWQEFFSLTKQLAVKIPNKYKTWLIIGTNGFRVAGAIYRQAKPEIVKKINLVYVQAKHYKGREKQNKVILSPILGEIKRPILVIDDLVDSADTILAVQKKIKQTKADTAVIFIKPWSKIKPTYYLAQTDKWIVFPWE